MVIDSSAVVTIILKEPGHPFYIEQISAAAVTRMSAASLLQTSIVVNSQKGSAGLEVLRRFIAFAGIDVASFSAGQSRLALAAYRQFGKGSGHPAQLNILDCRTYALAAETGEPVLFKGNDFGRTDIPNITQGTGY